jgi:hypothetical protein
MAKKSKPTDGLFPGFGQAPEPRRWEDVLADADQVATPAAARKLDPDLQRLARLCLVLAQDAGDQPFTLGTQRAAEIMGSPDFADGGAGLRVLVAVGLICLVRKGAPGKGCSTWNWCAPEEAPPEDALPPWARGNRQAAEAAWLN